MALLTSPAQFLFRGSTRRGLRCFLMEQAEVGLLPFARVALEVATQVLPPYRTRFSKHQFTQPQLLAVLCLMRYEDWTFREAETRLREHQELRAALKLREVPDYTTLYRFLRRLDDVTVERGLGETVRRLRRRRRRAVSVAIDGTGLSYNSVSTFFIRRLEQACRSQCAPSSLAEVGDCGGCAATDFVGAAGPSRARFRRPLAARTAGRGGTRYAHSAGAGGCRVRLGTQPPTHPTTPGSQKHHPRPAPRYSPRHHSESNVPRLSGKTVPPTRQDRNHLLGDQTQAFLPRSRAQLIHTDSPSPAARSCLQPLSLEASPHLGGCQQSQW